MSLSSVVQLSRCPLSSNTLSYSSFLWQKYRILDISILWVWYWISYENYITSLMFMVVETCQMVPSHQSYSGQGLLENMFNIAKRGMTSGIIVIYILCILVFYIDVTHWNLKICNIRCIIFNINKYYKERNQSCIAKQLTSHCLYKDKK